MYGKGIKTEEQHQADNEFIETVIERYGSLDSAARVHVELGWSYFYNNDLSAAMKRFNQAWLLDSSKADPYYGFSALTRVSNEAEANRLEKLALQRDPRKKRAKSCYHHAANCMESIGKLEHIIYYYGKLIELDQTEAFYYKKRGYIYSQTNALHKAVQDYTHALDLDPADALVYNNRGYVYQRLKQFDPAYDDYSKAIELNPEYLSAIINRALTLRSMNMPKLALADVNRCIDIEPNHAPFYAIKGSIQLELGEIDDACKAIATALSMGDTSAAELYEAHCP
ncbi:MAG: hypothetical protein Salg2KO_02660 [Salibacteraceae bacterium]